MKSFTVTISDAEEKAVLTDVLSIQDWLDNAIHNKARQCMDKIILEESDKQPAKIPKEERESIVMEAKVKSAVEKTKEMEEGLIA